MESKTESVRLTDLYAVSSGLSKPRDQFGFGHSFLTFKDVFDNYFVPAHLTSLVNSSESERDSCSIRRGDVFLTRTSETIDDLGMSCVALNDYPNATFNGFTKRLRPLSDRVVPEYAAYYFRSRKFREAVTCMSSLSTRASLNNDMISRLRIDLPPRWLQLAIGRILKSLDDKIELNRQMNATLEQMARELFKSWFIDFNPVRAKASGGQPMLMATEVALLFPNSFQRCKEGEIPVGWEWKTVSDFSEGIFDGPHATPPIAESGAVFLGLKNLTGTQIDLSELRFISEADWPKWTKRITPATGDIVFTYEATIGAFALIPDGLRCCLGRRLALVRPKGCPHFLFHWFISDPFQETLVNHTVHGSTVPRTSLLEFPRYDVLFPGGALIEVFERVASKIWSQIHSLQDETIKLRQTRDSLLPQLLSGKIRLRQADKLVEEALA